MKLLLPILSIIILTLAAAHAAEEPPVSPKPTAQRRPPPKWIQANDINKNGKLEPNEIAIIKAELAMKQAEFKRQYDADGDGKLSHEELKTMRQVLSAQRMAKERQAREEMEKLRIPAP